jgi:hypothetical protein
MLSYFRNPLSATGRIRTMPDHFDRARLATVGVLAAFALLALGFVMHLAASTVPLPIGGDSGQGQVLTTSDRASGAHGASGALGNATGAGAAGAGSNAIGSGANGAGAGNAAGAAGSNGQAGAGNSAGSNANAGKQVHVSIGSGAPSQPATPVAPVTTGPSSGTSTGTGTGTGSTGTGTGTGSLPGSGGDGQTSGLPGDTPPPPNSSNGHGGTSGGLVGTVPGHGSASSLPGSPSTGSTGASTSGTATTITSSISATPSGRLKGLAWGHRN